MGRLPDQVESRKTVESKIQTLRDHSEGLSSIEFRDPPRVWGGAVRNHEGDLWGLTGLPEIVDHLVMTHTLFYCGSLSQGLRERLLGTDCEGVVSAMGHARMDLHSYKKLVLLTGDIIAAAA